MAFKALRLLLNGSKTSSVVVSRPRITNMSTIAAFKIPKVSNEPNVSVQPTRGEIGANDCSIIIPKVQHNEKASRRHWRAYRRGRH